MSTKNNKNGMIMNTTCVLDENSPFILTETMRHLMSSISFAVPKKEKGGKVICISSAIAGEGKTTVATNLAITFANAGYKTALVDCDMRKPRVKNMFKLHKEKGIVDYLSGQVSFEEILKKSIRPNLDLVPTFKTAPNPAALFNSEEFDVMMTELEKNYDYVIVDTPPVNVVSDGILVATRTDGIVLITRPNHSDHKNIQAALNSIAFANIEFLGFVANNLEIKKSKKKNYYDRYYKYGYSDKGASTEEEEKAPVKPQVVEPVKPSVVEEESQDELVVGDANSIDIDAKRIPFREKLLGAEEKVQGFYNELYNKFISYRKMHARVSAKGVSFRFGRDLVAKITYRGKTMKLHLALDINAFDEKVYFQKDMSDVKSYVEVPFTVKVKSDRGLKKAFELIDALTFSKGIEQKTRFETVDAVAMLKEMEK